MGLIKEGDDFAVLSDILGDEDHLGDMDFKVAGTETGITSLQMDIKITSITPEIMKIALDQARDGRLHILGEMAKALTTARESLADSAPKISTVKIPVDKIRELIGPGGKVIREICEETGAKIDIEDDGTVSVAAVSQNPPMRRIAGSRRSRLSRSWAKSIRARSSRLWNSAPLSISSAPATGWCISLKCVMSALARLRMSARKAIWSGSR